MLTDEEKAEARATDPRAAAIVDAVDAMPPQIWERLHGDPRPAARGCVPDTPADPVFATDAPWWDPGADASVDPETDAILVGGVSVAKGSRVLLRPRPGGDVQDLFLAGRHRPGRAARRRRRCARRRVR